MLLLLACVVPSQSHAQPVLTLGADNVDEGSYTVLDAEVYTTGTPTCWFEWGLTTNYGNTISATIPVFWNPLPFQAYLLLTNPPLTTIYHFRAAAWLSAGITYGDDDIFITPGPPVITNQPQGQAVAPGSQVTLSVGAYGRPPPSRYIPFLGYQWELNGVAIASANTSSITITNAQSSDAGTYTVEVLNEDGTVVSSPAFLSVGLSPPPVLQANSSNGSFVLSWPVYQPSYKLKTSTSLLSTDWSNAPAIMVTNGNAITATIAIPASNGQQFFRLQYP